MKKIKVIIVDDSEVYRKILREVLVSHPEIDIVAEAKNGRLALPRIKFHKPDYVILDVNMPDMNGIETLENLNKTDTKAKVIMFSSANKKSATVTFEALKLGAIDFISKPDLQNAQQLESYIETYLIHKILSLAKAQEVKHVPASVDNKIQLHQNFDICAIGVSTGGPVALHEYFEHIDRNIQGAILVCQHMPKVFTKHFAESLNHQFPLAFHEAKEGQKIEKGNVYIAPGAKHLFVEKNGNDYYCKITDDEPREFCRPSVDNLFESVAKEVAEKSICIIMTGMGHDGVAGMVSLKSQNSYLMAQDLDTCLVKSMPSNVMQKVKLDYVGNLAKLAQKTNMLLGIMP